MALGGCIASASPPVPPLSRQKARRRVSSCAPPPPVEGRAVAARSPLKSGRHSTVASASPRRHMNQPSEPDVTL